MYAWLQQCLEQEYEQQLLLAANERRRLTLLRHKRSGGLLICRSFRGSGSAYRRLLGLRHANLTAVYEVAEQDGQVLVLEEYADGLTLAQSLSCRRFTPQEAAELGVMLCDGLWALHSREIIHRDVKPENVMLSANGQAKLFDYDAARLHNSQAGTDTVVLGTTGFAAPEQFGLAQTDCRTDIYALGVLLNVLLTGDHPVRAAAPQTWRQIIDRCTRLDPQQRYRDMLELKYELLQIQRRK